MEDAIVFLLAILLVWRMEKWRRGDRAANEKVRLKNLAYYQQERTTLKLKLSSLEKIPYKINPDALIDQAAYYSYGRDGDVLFCSRLNKNYQYNRSLLFKKNEIREKLQRNRSNMSPYENPLWSNLGCNG